MALPGTSGAAGDPELLGQWHLDQSVSSSTPDSSGHGNDLTGNPAAIVPGKFANAFQFADSNQQQRRVSATGLESPRVTVMSWVKASSNPGNLRYVMAKGAQACNGASWALYTGTAANLPGGGLRFYVYDGTDFHLSPAIGAGSVWNNQWHAVAGTFDGTRVRFYFDGNEVGSGTAAATAIQYALPNRDFTIGDYPVTCGNTDAHASIDEARVYNRALSGAEVRQLQLAGGPNPPDLDSDGDGIPNNRDTCNGCPATSPPPIAAVAARTRKTVRVRRSAFKSQLGVWIGAGKSRARGTARIVRYSYDFDGNGKTDADCPADAPAVYHQYRRSGRYRARIKVVDSQGGTDTEGTTLTVKTFKVKPKGSQAQAAAKRKARRKRKRGPSDISACITQADEQQPSTADCVRSFKFGIIDVNARSTNCFTVNQRFPPGAQQCTYCALPSAGSALLALESNATVRGPVAINGLPVPLRPNDLSEYDSGRGTIHLGSPTVAFNLGDRRIKLPGLDLNRTIEENKRHRLGEVDIGGFGNLGGLDVGGKARVDFVDGRTELFLNVRLPNLFSTDPGKPADARLKMSAGNIDPFRLENFHVRIPYAFLGPVLMEDFDLEYQGQDDSWEGGALLRLPGTESPFQLDMRRGSGPDNGIGFRGGGLSHAGAELGFSDAAAPQIFPGVFLTHIRFRIGTNPTRFLGGVTLHTAKIVRVNGDLFMVFAGGGDPYTMPAGQPPGLSRLAGRTFRTVTVAGGGGVSFDTPIGRLPLGSAFVLYQYPDYFEFGGGVDVPLGVFEVKGEAAGFFQPSAGRFNIEGQGKFCAVEVGCFLGAGMVLSSRGIAACISVGPADVGAGYYWGGAFEPYFWSCDIGDYRAFAARRTARASASTFRLKAGLPSASLIVHGIGGAPRLTIRGPKGEVFRTGDRKRVVPDGDLAFIRVNGNSTAYIGIRKPSAGTWTVTADPGSPPIRSVRVANGLAAPKVKVRVSGNGSTRTLSYRVSKQSGLRVVFAEQGADAYRRIGVAKGAKGRLRFKPSITASRARKIVATIERGGLATRSITVARFRAPRKAPPSKPGKVRVRRKGTTLRVSWRRATRAVRYAVVVTTSDGGHRLVITRRRSLRIRGIQQRGVVTVRGLLRDNTRGKAGRGRFKRVRR